MKKTVVIVAGGSGLRMKSDLPKQFIDLNGLPVLMRTINCFYEFDSNIEIRIVLPAEQIPFWERLCDNYEYKIKHRVFEGGKTRFHSVKNGLKGLGKNELVAVHDGVRPFVSAQTIKDCYDSAEVTGSAIPVISVQETIRVQNKKDSKTVDRDKYKLVQTPQVFLSDIILMSYNQEYSEAFTDDASVVEAAGYPITLVDGNRENIKITNPVDMLIAQALLIDNYSE